MNTAFRYLQNERWARTVGVVSALIVGALQVIAEADTWQVAVSALVPFVLGFVTERKVWSQASVDDFTAYPEVVFVDDDLV